MDINIKVTGLDKLAEGLLAFASAQKEVINVAQYQAMPEHAPAAKVPTPAAPNAAPAAAPAHVHTIPAGSQLAAQPGPAAAPTAPAAAPGYTTDELSRVAMNWFQADPAQETARLGQLRALNAEFGVQHMGEIPPERLGAYALRLRQLGVAI